MHEQQRQQERYTTTAIVFHWLIAVLIVGAFTLGLVMTDIPGFSPAKLRYYSWHKWAGVTVLLLAALRLLWRLKNRPPVLRPRCRPGSAAPPTACTICCMC
jgi:cytochrome b561